MANSTSSVPPIFACGAGTSGDLDAVTRQMRYSMKLQHLQEETIGNREQSPLSYWLNGGSDDTDLPHDDDGTYDGQC